MMFLFSITHKVKTSTYMNAMKCFVLLFDKIMDECLSFCNIASLLII